LRRFIEGWYLSYFIPDQARRLQEAGAENISVNSSKPPASEGPAEGAEREAVDEGDRSQGAQPGHEGRWREDVPAEEVDEVVDVKPEECRGCGDGLSGTDSEPECHQVTDGVIERHVREWRTHTLECPSCGTWTHAQLPDEAPDQQFGPTIAAIVTDLTGALPLSKREARGAADEVFGVEMSLGTVSNLEGRVSEGLRAPWEQARGWLTEAERVHLDETTWVEAFERRDNPDDELSNSGDVVTREIPFELPPRKDEPSGTEGVDGKVTLLVRSTGSGPLNRFCRSSTWPS